MTTIARPVAGLMAAGAILLLVAFLFLAPAPERPVTLHALALLSLVWFSRPAGLSALVVIVPLGVIFDFVFLTPARTVYATEIIVLGAVAAVGARRAIRGWNPETPDGGTTLSLPIWLWLVFAGVGMASLAGGHFGMLGTIAGLRGLRVLFLAAAVCLLFVDLGSQAKLRQSSVRIWSLVAVIGLGVLSLGGLVEFAAALASGGADEPGSFYRSSVGLSGHLAFLAPLSLSLALAGAAGRWRWLGAAAWLLTIVCLPLTASRGAMASVAITTIILIPLLAGRLSHRQKRAVWLLCVALALGVIFLMVKPEIAGESFAYKLQKSVAGDFFSTRSSAWQEAWQAIRQRPLFGEGAQASSPSIPLELARRYGIPTALLGMAALLAPLWRRWHRGSAVNAEPADGGLSSDLNLGLTLCFVGLIIVGLAETGLGARMTPLVASAIWCQAQHAQRR